MSGYPSAGVGAAPADFPQVGTGWAFPVRWSPAGVLATSAGEEHVREAIRLVLWTALGSRVMRPDFGAGVERYVFESRTDATCRRLESDVRRALLLGEPRVIVERVEAAPAGAAEDRIDVLVEFRIDRHRRPTSIVLPFATSGEQT